MALHCPECGFVNADGANYCQKCGSYLGALEERAGGEPSTATYRIDETGEDVISGADVARLTDILAGRASQE